MRAAAAELVGELDQVPTAVSAIKVDGRRAYARVRAGEEVTLEPRRVTVHELTVHEVRPGAETLDLDVTVRCSSGTYVRALARDLGAALGVGGHLTALRRTAVGSFGIADAHTLDQLADDFAMVPLSEAARATFPTLELDERAATDVRFGRALELPDHRPDSRLRSRRGVPGPLRAARRPGPRRRRLRLTGCPPRRRPPLPPDQPVDPRVRHLAVHDAVFPQRPFTQESELLQNPG